MFLTYAASLATPGNLTTNASANTETDAFAIAGYGSGLTAGLLSVQLMGKSSALTTISGIVMRFCKFATASTGGTSMAPHPVDPGLAGQSNAVVSRPIAGSTRTNHHVAGCGAAGPGGFVSELLVSMMKLPGASAASIDGMDASGTVSLPYELSLKFVEGTG